MRAGCARLLQHNLTFKPRPRSVSRPPCAQLTRRVPGSLNPQTRLAGCSATCQQRIPTNAKPATLPCFAPQGRAIAGEDSLESLTSRAGAYAKRVKWVNANAGRLAEVIRKAQALRNETANVLA